MKIVMNYPPNIDQIRKNFRIPHNAVFTFGDTIYSPHRAGLDEHLQIHEGTHTTQQGDDPAGWWDKYLKDPQFRLDQELQAYINQFESFKKKNNSQKSLEFASSIAGDLASPMYGGIISFEKAFKLITKDDFK
jgi:hypothetical protein